ncbi:MAG: Rne/Rng family ribonuclease [Candidatus Sericytochromatia bacterium]|nr:Rne/Rng family ribonuclease [Candidatus Sericytochromatia bacterium]
MSKEIVVSESEKIAVVLEKGVVQEFYLSEGEQNVGDIILATVESIVPAIEAAFLNIGREKSGFIHVSDLPASKKQQSGIRQYLKLQQQMLVQVTREPTGNKGACLTGFIQLPGRFLVLTPFERRIGLSKRIFDARERARLARIARMICGSGYGIVLRPEAVGQSEQTLRDDLKILLGRWKHILAQSEKQNAGATLYRDQDILERILREGATSAVSRIIVDGQGTFDRAMKYFGNWSDTKARDKVRLYNGQVPILSYYGIYQQLEKAIQPMVHLPSGGTLVIQQTEALTSIDINTSSMTSTDNQPETILRTNCEAAEEIARQLVLRDIGGVIVIDFIDMDNPRDQQIVWQKLADALHHDKAQPQINYFSDFGLVEMTRRRQRQRLSEMLTMPCPTCQGVGRIRNLLYRSDILTGEGMKMRMPVIQPEEKQSRYKGGSEKNDRPEKSERQSSSSSSSSSSSRQNGRNRNAAPAPAKPAPVEKPRFIAPPEPEQEVSSSKAQIDERPEDLLFDDSIFTSELTEEILSSYIEREDDLNVPPALAKTLDSILEQIATEGIASLSQRKHEVTDAEEAEDDDSDADETSAQDFEDEDSSSQAPEEAEETEEAPEAAVKKPARSRSGTRKRSSKAAEAEVSEPDAEEAEAAQPDEASAQDSTDSSAHDEAESDTDATERVPAANLAESVLSRSGTESAEAAKPAKRLLTRRRTIRSFRPKR